MITMTEGAFLGMLIGYGLVCVVVGACAKWLWDVWPSSKKSQNSRLRYR